MYLMNPDLAFGRDRMRERLRRAEMVRLAREAGRREEAVGPSVAVAGLSTLPAPVECGPCQEPVAA
jgi:hypothetical protein